MEVILKRKSTPSKNIGEQDPQTPTTVTLRRSIRSSESRSKSRENGDNANEADPQTPTTVTLRRSIRSSESRSKSRENEDNSNEADPQTPTTVTLRRSIRSSERRSKSRENEDNANEADLQTPTTRRSSRISEKRIKKEIALQEVEVVDVVHEDVECDVDVEADVPSTNYFSENPDMYSQGKDIFSFRTPKKKGAMVALAVNTPKSILKYVGTPKSARTQKTPRTPKTPKSTMKFIQSKTPSHIRSKLQKGVRNRCKIYSVAEEDEEDFEDSADEYKPSESSESENDDEAMCSSDDETPVQHNVQRSVKKTLQSGKTRFSTRHQNDFIFESDKYFGQTNRKNATSDNTLDSLKTPRLQHDDLFKLIADHKMSDTHQNCIRDLQSQYETFFPKWLFILKEGYSLLLHGLGSKRNILEKLHSTCLAHENVLVVNGYFPSLTIKDVLDDIVTGLLEVTCKSKNLHEIVDVIEEEMNQTPEYHIFLIIHNLDGAMLRNDMAQNLLSRLAHIKNIHLIASIDHINAPHLWDNIQLTNYNFSWWDVSSFLPYTDETSVVDNSMLLKNSGGVTMSSMKSVLVSITQNARGIYKLIIENQLAANKTSNYQGMPFRNLYKKCLENFLVSSDIILRAQLTEFCDHNMLTLKRTADGTEQLKIPIDNILLQQFVEQYDDW